MAHDLDSQERALMGNAALSGEYESANVRSDGFFSVQVIVSALQRLGLVCTQQASGVKDPAGERGFIFNRREHWFALRRVGRHWFDLNSMSKAPVAMSETHLALFFQAHQEKGYSIFCVRGPFPASPLENDADALAAAVRACDDVEAKAKGGADANKAEPAFNAFAGPGQTLSAQPQIDPDLAAAAANDPELAAAIAMSMSEMQANAPPKKKAEDDMDEIRRKRLARFA